jgi:hypothetical protein
MWIYDGSAPLWGAVFICIWSYRNLLFLDFIHAHCIHRGIAFYVSQTNREIKSFYRLSVKSLIFTFQIKLLSYFSVTDSGVTIYIMATRNNSS